MSAPTAHEHVCLVYDEPAAFLGAARAFLTEGLRAGQRLVFVGSPDTHASLGVDGVTHSPTSDVYAEGVVVEPQAQVKAYRALAAAALADGFTGFRVVAQATPLVRTAAQLEAFLRYEHLIDRYMSTHPMAAMCAYDRGVLDEPALTRLASVHPRSAGDLTPFHLFACPPSCGSVALSGELDMASHDLLPEALDRADVEPVDGALVFDLSGLRFADHRSILALVDYATRRGYPAVLRAVPAATRRLVELIGLDLKVER
jgi:anti-anti-sigma regulatory factor